MNTKHKSPGRKQSRKQGRKPSKKSQQNQNQSQNQRQWQNRKLILIAACVVLILASAPFLTAFLSLSKKLPQQADGYTLSVERGDSLIRVLDRLYAQDMIYSPTRIRLWMRILNLPTNIQAGEYALESGMRYRDFLRGLATGKQISYRVQALNGKTYEDFYTAILADPKIKKTLPRKSTTDIMRLLHSDYPHPEGLFYADTYAFYKKTTDLEILQGAHTKLKTVLAEEWEDRQPDLPYKNSYEALVMASIIERETSLEEERALVAGVFVNRLRKGMRLQADPTVIYGMGDRYKGDIRKRDLQERTAYNTYLIKGLPPTPIGLVDRRAIRAALQPAQTDYLFFVAKGRGVKEHYFSVTYEEHKKAVQKYLLGK